MRTTDETIAEIMDQIAGAKPGLHVPAERRSETDWLAQLLRTTAKAVPTEKKK